MTNILNFHQPKFCGIVALSTTINCRIKLSYEYDQYFFINQNFQIIGMNATKLL